MTARSRLPDRRRHESFELTWQGLCWSIGVGRDRLGQIAEIFVLDRCKSAPAFESALRGAITRNSDGSSASTVGAILDVIAEGEQ
jgi:hypothetical protein